MRNRLLLATISVFLGTANPAWAQADRGKPDLAKAQQIVNSVCAACHGADGNSPTPANPNLAGQHAAYLTLQLTHFKSGVRANPVMAGMAASLSPEDMQALGVYFSQQTPKGLAAKDSALVTAGRQLYRGGNSAAHVPACAACHAPTGVGIPVRYPRLSGQYADYTYAQLKAFKTGERGADKAGLDVNGKVMAQIAAHMTDEEMRAAAEYATGLH